MKNEIRIRRGLRGEYFAQYRGPHTAEILNLFGTDTLPLPSTSGAIPEQVFADIVTRFPNVIVSMEGN